MPSKPSPARIAPLPHFPLGMEQFYFYQHITHTSEAHLKCKAHVLCLDSQQTVTEKHSDWCRAYVKSEYIVWPVSKWLGNGPGEDRDVIPSKWAIFSNGAHTPVPPIAFLQRKQQQSHTHLHCRLLIFIPWQRVAEPLLLSTGAWGTVGWDYNAADQKPACC